MVEQSFNGFDVLCTPTFLDEREGRGSRWGGLPTFAVVLADVLVGFRVVGVVFAIFGVRSPLWEAHAPR